MYINDTGSEESKRKKKFMIIYFRHILFNLLREIKCQHCEIFCKHKKHINKAQSARKPCSMECIGRYLPYNGERCAF